MRWVCSVSAVTTTPFQVERHEESREAGDLAPVIAASRWAAGAAPCREPRLLLPSTASVSAPSGSLPVRSAGPPGQTVPMTRRGTRRERRRPGHRAGTGCAAGLRWPTVRSPGRNAPRRAPPRPRPAARSPAGDAGRAGHADPAAMRVDPPDECPMRVDARVQSRGRQTGGTSKLRLAQATWRSPAQPEFRCFRHGSRRPRTHPTDLQRTLNQPLPPVGRGPPPDARQCPACSPVRWTSRRCPLPGSLEA